MSEPQRDESASPKTTKTLDDVYAKLVSIDAVLHNLEQDINQHLSRPHHTVVTLTAFGEQQLKRFLRILYNLWRVIQREHAATPPPTPEQLHQNINQYLSSPTEKP